MLAETCGSGLRDPYFPEVGRSLLKLSCRWGSFCATMK